MPKLYNISVTKDSWTYNLTHYMSTSAYKMMSDSHPEMDKDTILNTYGHQREYKFS